MRFSLQCASFLAVLAASASAFAEPHRAPITFGGQGGAAAADQVQVASVAPGLSGGDDNSYGYGRQARARSGAVIDLRRSGAEQGAAAPAQPAAAQQEAPNWLERERVGPPYQANGRWYVPTAEPGYEQSGTASWYGPQFHGQRTASGEVFDQDALTAAHPTLPIPSLVQVTNLENGREIIVRVNDRGPFIGERLIDLSRRSAEVLGFQQQGQARVHIRYLGPAPRRFDDASAPAPAPLAAPEPEQAPPALAQNDGPASLLPPSSAAAEETPAAPPAMAPAQASGGYFVQVGAFSDLDNAHRVRASVAGAGPVNVDSRQTASGELFRVRMGPYSSREEAEGARLAIADLGYGNAILASR